LGAVGWAKPVDLDPGRLRGGRAAVLVVIAAATLSVLALALVAVLALPFAARVTTGGGVSMLAAGLAALARGAVGFALFNLVPLLPLAAGYLIDAALPTVARWLREQPLVPALLLVVLVATGVPGQVLGRPVTALLALV